MKPDIEIFPEFYRNYIRAIPDGEIVDLLHDTIEEMSSVIDPLPENQGGHAYAEGKWSLSVLIQHIIDSERVFVFRAVSLARKEPKELPGFEQEDYAKHYRHRPLKDLMTELRNVRVSTIDFFSSLTQEELENKGVANGYTFTPRMVGYVTAGHMAHHIRIIREKYLVQG